MTRRHYVVLLYYYYRYCTYIFHSAVGSVAWLLPILNTPLCTGPRTHTNIRVSCSKCHKHRILGPLNLIIIIMQITKPLYYVVGTQYRRRIFLPAAHHSAAVWRTWWRKSCVYVHTRRIGWPGAVCGTNAMKWLQKAGGAHDWRSKACGVRRLWQPGNEKVGSGKCAAKLPSFCAAERRKHVQYTYFSIFLFCPLYNAYLCVFRLRTNRIIVLYWCLVNGIYSFNVTKMWDNNNYCIRTILDYYINIIHSG